MQPRHRSHRSWKAAFTACAALALLSISASACTSKDSEGSKGGSDSTTTKPSSEVLGEKNAATGSPITIGVITDGEASFGDTKPTVEAFDATIEYANEYLGGINGHVIETKACETGGTPAGGTQCAVEMTDAKVDTVMVPVSAQDGLIAKALADTDIPYIAYTSASQEVLLGQGAFVLTNAISQIAVPALTAKAEGIDKVAFVIIDVPAATGPITSLAQPIFDKEDVELQIVPIAPSTADMTPQIQEAMGGGAGQFSVTGTDDFNIDAVNSLNQLAFDGTVMLGNPSQAVIDGIDEVEGLQANGTTTADPDDEDVQLFAAVLDKYAPDSEPTSQSAYSFSMVLGYVEALTGVTDAVDAPSIGKALSSMPEPIDLPLGGGITFQCGSDPVAFAPNICSIDVLSWSYDADGQRVDFKLVEVPSDIFG